MPGHRPLRFATHDLPRRVESMNTNLDWMAGPDHRDEHVDVRISPAGLARCAAANALLRATAPTEPRSHKVMAAAAVVLMVTAITWKVVQVWQEGGLS